MIKAMVLFLAAGLAEIGGGYLVWLWLRESKPLWVGVLGGSSWCCTGSFPPYKVSRILAASTPLMAGFLLFWPFFGDGSLDLYDWAKDLL